jgi:hypothetical protein
MASQNLNVGTSANSNDGDTLRAAFIKLKKMFAEVYGQTYSEQGDLSGTDFKINESKLQLTASGTAADDGKVLTYDHATGGFSWEDAFTGTIGDITGIVAGDGLTGSSLSSGDATINVVAGTGITVAADSVSLATSVQDEITANTAKTGITATQAGHILTNNAKVSDQTVTLTEGANVTITGTYPSFTIASDDVVGAVTSVNGDAGVVVLDTDDVSQGTTNLYNVTHTGDVSDASGVLTIADNVVNATKLDVTGNGSAGQLLQSDGDGSMTWVTGVTGDVTGVTAGDGLAGGGTSGDLTISLDTGVAGDGLTLTSGVLDVSVATSQIADNAVTSPKLAEFDDTFTAGTSGDIIVSNGTDFIHATMSGDATIVSGGAITIANDAVTTDKILNDAVTADKLADSINTDIAAGVAKVSNVTHTGEVTGSGALTITDGAVVADRLATDAVTTDKILDNAVDYDKLGTEFTTSTSFTEATDFDVDWSTAAIFTTSSSGAMDLRFTNAEVGQVKTIIVTASGGASSLTFDNSMTITTLNGSYSATAGAVNYIQAVCTATDTFFLTISQAA